MANDLTAPDNLIKFEAQSGEEYPNVFYVRHASMKASDDFIEEMCDDGRIIVHHADYQSINPSDYDKDETSRYAKNDIRDLRDATEDGALVGATYGVINKKFTRVGVIEPGTDVKFAQRHYDGKERIYKTVEFGDYIDVDFVECPVLFVARSRRGPTISRYSTPSKRAIQAIIDGDSVTRNVWSLSPGQFELLARRDIEARHENLELRLPSGRTLKDVDIIGIDKNNSDILAQVTLKTERSEIETKRNNLLSYGADERYLYHPQEPADICDGYDVTSCVAEKVFNRLDQDTKASSHISKMLDLSRVGFRFNN